MIDNIIFNKIDKELIFDEIYNSNDPRLLFLFFYYNPEYKTSMIVEKMIELSNSRYLHFLIRIITPEYYDKLLKKLLTFDSAKLIYYVAFDTKKLNLDQLKLIFDKLIELKNKIYIFLFINYIYFVKKIYNEEIIEKINSVLREENIELSDINEENIKNYVVKYKKINDYEYDGFSHNCFQERDIIPDMIVCHVCNNYESAIETFYDPKSEVSAHFVISRDGKVKQIISLDDCAWANGTSLRDESDIYYNFSNISDIRERKTNANFYTFSIEHESFDGSLTQIQYEASLKTICKIIDYIKEKYNYNFIIDRKHLIGHNEVNPIVRTSCPGEKFPFNELISDLKTIYNK